MMGNSPRWLRWDGRIAHYWVMLTFASYRGGEYHLNYELGCGRELPENCRHKMRSPDFVSFGFPPGLVVVVHYEKMIPQNVVFSTIKDLMDNGKLPRS
jgi:hypothetical protein